MRTYTCDRCGKSDQPVYQMGYRPLWDKDEWVGVDLDLCESCIKLIKQQVAQTKADLFREVELGKYP